MPSSTKIIEIKVPVLPESVQDATIVAWHKKIGDAVKRDENLVDLETDKVVLEVPAPSDGVLVEILKPQGSTVIAQELLAKIDISVNNDATIVASNTVNTSPTAPESAPDIVKLNMGPSARRAAAEIGTAVQDIVGTGKDGRVTKQDILNKSQDASLSLADSSVKNSEDLPAFAVKQQERHDDGGGRVEKRVPMTRLRARIAERLVESQKTAAILTTFNEINMQPIMDIRAKYKDQFEKEYGVKLGFMSFFVRACVESLKRFPAVNASIDGNDIVYHGYFDIGVAISSDRGLVVPILKDADRKSMAIIEKEIRDFGIKAQKGQLTIDEMTGGTFTVSNGGVFGSLLSTPIINPPQSAILGMHKIEERPVVENKAIVIRPMMYVALSYDHRIIDGKESVSFLRTIKELLEDPARAILDV